MEKEVGEPMAKKRKKGRPVRPAVPQIKDFPDMIAPTAGEEDAIIHNAQNKNRMDRGNTNNMRRNKEPLVHCTVFIELYARDDDGLRTLRDKVSATLTRSKPSADRLFLVQRNGFLPSNPAGSNGFASQFERVLPRLLRSKPFPLQLLREKQSQRLLHREGSYDARKEQSPPPREDSALSPGQVGVMTKPQEVTT